jgi:hypothetical protein
MAGLIRRIAIREIRPLRSGTQNPEHPVEQLPPILARPTAAVLAPRVPRQQRLEQFPLGIRDVHSDIPTRGASDLRELAETGAAKVAWGRTSVAGF